jgi:hypothetical protein
MPSDRRKHRRLSLRLRLARLDGLSTGELVAEAWTSNISTGGMYVVLPSGEAPEPGRKLIFELQVPAGDGYSPSGGKIRGAGAIVRADAASGVGAGIGVQFLPPLALEF